MLSRHLWLQRPVALQTMSEGLEKKKKKKGKFDMASCLYPYHRSTDHDCATCIPIVYSKRTVFVSYSDSVENY